MAKFPEDPMILLSWTNMKLRDYYSSLEALCDDLEIEKDALESILDGAGFTYDPEHNKFR